jgi:hypothetical protein
MKKSLRMLLATMIFGAAVAAASIAHSLPGSSGADPVPICPPDGCVISN